MPEGYELILNSYRMKTAILGSGNVAFALGQRLKRTGTAISGIYARNTVEGKKLAHICGCEYTGDLSALAESDLYILAVSDSAIGELSEKLAESASSGVVVHTSGGTPLSALSGHIRNRGVLYPFQTFSKGREVDFSDVPVFIEAADADVLSVIRQFALKISPFVLQADSQQRRVIHLSGVFACNFVNHLYAAAEKILDEAALPFDMLNPLIRETAEKAIEKGDPARLQTGPAVRGDEITLQKHREMLHDEHLKKIYDLLSASIRSGI